VPLTVEEIVEEVRCWKPNQIEELVCRLNSLLHESDPAIEAAWEVEIERRLDELRTGKVKAIPYEEVTARLRKLIKQRMQ
jgi:putative addiction module component (TIGR02574 family)